jgi:CheY-like chemotaxis protein
MNEGIQTPKTKPQWNKDCHKISILLIDNNSERRSMRRKIMAIRGVEIIGASDLAEASSIWHRDRYDMVLIDIRSDHRGCMAFRDEIKKDSAHQIVAFLVGRPKFIDLEPLLGSYVAEEYGVQWGDGMRKAIRESCDSLLQRNGLVEATWRIAAGRKINGTPQNNSQTNVPVLSPLDFVPDSPDA